jgi:hypothetical protein
MPASQDTRIHWVDRFDHPLSEDEYRHLPWISFADVRDEGAFLDYIQVERQLKGFVVDVLTGSEEAVDDVLCKAAARAPFDEYLDEDTERWKLELLLQMAGNPNRPFAVEDPDTLDFLLELGLREHFELRLKAQETILEIGQDLMLYFQCIDIGQLSEKAHAHGLYLLQSWQPTMWDDH